MADGSFLFCCFSSIHGQLMQAAQPEQLQVLLIHTLRRPASFQSIVDKAKEAPAHRCIEQGQSLAAVAGAQGCLGRSRHLPHLYDVLIDGMAHWGPPCMHVTRCDIKVVVKVILDGVLQPC